MLHRPVLCQNPLCALNLYYLWVHVCVYKEHHVVLWIFWGKNFKDMYIKSIHDIWLPDSVLCSHTLIWLHIHLCMLLQRFLTLMADVFKVLKWWNLVTNLPKYYSIHSRSPIQRLSLLKLYKEISFGYIIFTATASLSLHIKFVQKGAIAVLVGGFLPINLRAAKYWRSARLQVYRSVQFASWRPIISCRNRVPFRLSRKARRRKDFAWQRTSLIIGSVYLDNAGLLLMLYI